MYLPCSGQYRADPYRSRCGQNGSGGVGGTRAVCDDVAGIGSLLQLFPIWRFGSGLPIIMGISFTFVSVACIIGTKYGYGAVLVLRSLAAYWKVSLFWRLLVEEIHPADRVCVRRDGHRFLPALSGQILLAAALAIQILVPRIT